MQVNDWLDAFEWEDALQVKREEKLPKCRFCGSPIYEDYAVYLDGWICDDCVRDLKRNVEDWSDEG